MHYFQVEVGIIVIPRSREGSIKCCIPPGLHFNIPDVHYCRLALLYELQYDTFQNTTMRKIKIHIGYLRMFGFLTHFARNESVMCVF